MQPILLKLYRAQVQSQKALRGINNKTFYIIIVYLYSEPRFLTTH